MRRSGVVLCLLLAACGHDSRRDGGSPGGGNPGGGNPGGGNPGGGDPGGGDPDGGNGSDPGPHCDTVCWTAVDRPPTPPTPPTPVDVVLDQCNVGGIAPGVCPAGFACTGTAVTQLDDTHTFTRAMCEPSQPILPTLVFDLGADPVVVHFDFTLNGGEWPTSSTPGAAGQIEISSSAGSVFIVSNLPTQSSGLDIALAPGTYDVSFLPFNAGFDRTRYPNVSLRGTLVVVAAGSVHLDLRGQPITVALRLDGAPFPALAAGERLSLTFAGFHEQTIQTAAGLDGTSAVVVLEPDTYEVTLDTNRSDQQSTIPVGRAVLAERFEVTTAGPAVFDVTSFPISGAVRIDGADVPANANALVSFGGRTGFAVTPPPSRYEGRLLAGTYDVVFAGSGSVRLPSSFTAGPSNLDIDLTTTTFSGSLTLNGAAPAGQPRGAIVLSVPNTPYSSQVLSFFGASGATWNRRVFTGTYDVRLLGEDSLPQYDTAVLEPELTISAPLNRTYDLQTGVLNLTVLSAGAQPADSTSDRPTLLLQPGGPAAERQPDLGRRLFLTPSRAGPFTVSALLEAGTWSVTVENFSGYTGLPGDLYRIGEVSVAAGGVTTATLDVRPVTVAGELRFHGAPLPPAAPGATRQLFFVSDLFNFLPFVDLPASGPATFSVPVMPGNYDLRFLCRGECAEGVEQVVDNLASGLRIR